MAIPANLTCYGYGIAAMGLGPKEIPIGAAFRRTCLLSFQGETQAGACLNELTHFQNISEFGKFMFLS